MITNYGPERTEISTLTSQWGLDSAQVTDLVGLYILNELYKMIQGLRGKLYRDDALFYMNSTNKSNQTLFYIYHKSNHPNSMKKALIPSISKRISKISQNEELFNKNKEYYNQALARWGYKEQIKFVKETQNNNIGTERTINNANVISYNMSMRKYKKGKKEEKQREK